MKFWVNPFPPPAITLYATLEVSAVPEPSAHPGFCSDGVRALEAWYVTVQAPDANCAFKVLTPTRSSWKAAIGAESDDAGMPPVTVCSRLE